MKATNAALVLSLSLAAALALPGPGLTQTPGFEGLNATATAAPTPTPAQDLTVGAWHVTGQPVKTWHMYFERDLDAPDFFNFESWQQYKPLAKKFVNGGTCYGISLFTLRYYQWFVLPHLLTDEQLAARKARSFPTYARSMARDFGLPAWVLGDPADDGQGGRLTADARRARIQPWRLRKLLTSKPAIADALAKSLPDAAKDHSARVFDNQMLLMRKGAQVASVLDRLLFRKVTPKGNVGKFLFSDGPLGLMVQYLDDPALGAFELGFYGSKVKGFWGHSVVGYKVTQFTATKKGSSQPVEAFRIDLYDSNDPTNTSDDCVWFMSDARGFVPSAGYADFYDGDSPLLPKGKDVLNPAQMAASAEHKLLEAEANIFNKLMLKYKAVGQVGN